MALRHNITTFSDGWLSQFKARRGMVFIQIYSECNSIHVDAVTEWKTKHVPVLLASYAEKDILVQMQVVCLIRQSQTGHTRFPASNVMAESAIRSI